MHLDNILNILIDNEENSNSIINMVPSENYSSAVTRIPLLFDVNNRYFFNATREEKKWSFRGAQDVSTIETDIAIPIIKKMTNSKFVNLRPISGLNAMSIILNALGNTGNKRILTVSPEMGGHYATKSLAESFGLVVDYLEGLDEHKLDETLLISKLKKRDYSLVYIDQSNCLFPLDIEILSRLIKAHSPQTLLHVDASHWLGMILGNAMQNPLLAGADSFSGSTHKTFPGPQRAIFCTNDEYISDLVQDKQFYMISSHHFGSVVSLAMAMIEFSECGGEDYANQIVKNAVALASKLDSLGYDVKGKKYGYSEGNQIWLNTNNIGCDSYEASERLSNIGINVNVFDELPGHNGNILRIGVNEITRFGALEIDMHNLASIIDDAIRQQKEINILRKKVNDLRANLTCYYGKDAISDEMKERLLVALKNIIL